MLPLLQVLAEGFHQFMDTPSSLRPGVGFKFVTHEHSVLPHAVGRNHWIVRGSGMGGGPGEREEESVGKMEREDGQREMGVMVSATCATGFQR